MDRRISPRGWAIAAIAGALCLAGGTLSPAAGASFVKAGGNPPLAMPNTLGLEGVYPPAALVRPGAVATRWGSCAASAVRFPGVGTRIVTARHCGGENIQVFDEQSEVYPTSRHDAPGDVDVSLLETAKPLPWPGLELRSAATVEPGERLCAFRVERSPRGVDRERICARLLRTVDRAGAPPLLLLSHPYPPGTSGSALVDRQGRVVGVVVATTTETGLAEPIDAALGLLGRGAAPASAPEEHAAPGRRAPAPR